MPNVFFLGVWHCDGLDEDVPIGSYIQMLVLGWWCCLGGGYGTLRRWRLAGRSVSLEVTLRFYSLVYFLLSLCVLFVGDSCSLFLASVAMPSTLYPTETLSPNYSFFPLILAMLLHHSNRRVRNYGYNAAGPHRTSTV